eukprot:COSAG06_NODE_9194_length_1960_cov_9.463729_1_plen_25_part_10
MLGTNEGTSTQKVVGRFCSQNILFR